LAPFFSLLPTADEIAEWARSHREAEHQLATLIHDLIAYTAKPTNLDIPTGKAIVQPGFDGIVETPQATMWVPAGKSFWEWGVSDPPDRKAAEEYGKDRTDQIDEATQLASTFVFVTPHRWSGRRDWLTARRLDGRWGDVKAIDASGLEGWLKFDTVTHLWLAEIIHGSLAGEVRALESFWEEWADRFYPPKSAIPELVLAGRDQQAELLRSWVGVPNYFSFRADTPDEGMAFIAASLLASPAHADFIRQAVIVRSPETWLRLMARDRQRMILVPTYPSPWVRKATDQGHTVIQPVEIDRRGEFEFTLEHAREKDLVPALVAMGLDPALAGRVAKDSRGVMVALQRQLSLRPSAPDWASPTHMRFLGPAAMAGRWDEALESDQAVLAHLAGTDYATLQAALATLTDGPDPPVTLVGSVWSVASPRDVWRQIASRVSRATWHTFETEAVEVLSAPDPAWELDPDERWLANVKDRRRPHSVGLRQGLAVTLAAAGSQTEFSVLQGGLAGQDLAARVAHRLLRGANEDPSGHGWADLEDVLPALAEAAPNVFLAETQRGLEGEEPVLRHLFAEERGLLSPRSHIYGLLWALERLAWSAEYLPAVAAILGRLVALDPGRSSGNRPGRSFSEIFLPWHPQTSADAPRRLAAIDAARRAAPYATWPLLLRLLPKWQDIGGMTSKPEWRDWAPTDEVKVTFPAYWSEIGELLDRLLMDAGRDAHRWKDLVESYDDLRPDFGDRILAGLRTLKVKEFAPEDLELLADAMAEVVSNHRAFAHAEWAMPRERVTKLAAVAKRFRPADPVLKGLWLFVAHPATQRVSGRDYEHYEVTLASKRSAAVSAVLKQRGWEGVEDLIARAAEPYTVGGPIASLDDPDAQERLLAWASADDQAKSQALAGYLFARNRRDGWQWTAGVVRARAEQLSDERVARFLLAASREPQAWELAHELGPSVEQFYWASFDGLPRGASQWVAIEKLIENDRPFAAIQIIGLNLGDRGSPFDSQLAFAALESATLVATPPRPAEITGFAYELAEILKKLDAEGYDPLKLAGIEWVFLRVLEHQEEALKHIRQRMANEPDFFVEVVSLVFRAHDQDPPAEPDPTHVRYAEQAFALLRSWHGPIPGATEDGKVNPTALDGWVDAARASLQAAGRGVIGDQRIGHALWYAPAGEDGLHPHEAVRALLERVGSQEIDVGYSVEAFNSRGVVTRGPGGDQERELAKRYGDLAKSFSATWHRTAGIYRRLEDEYERLGRFEDEREAQDP
jgi:hypothetical protein